ncbi:MAG TPA: Smr/MutS family protein [Vicinamibacteria bacterium]|nr:Smr/MutS family protein [Vicinamibacteria bacterium]
MEGDPPEGGEPPDEVEIPITGELDLHPFSPRDVVAVAADYLDACRERGILTVRLVHGRGKGVQRAAVRRMLGGREDVVSFADADPVSGGWGATIVVLRAATPRAPAP